MNDDDDANVFKMYNDIKMALSYNLHQRSLATREDKKIALNYE